MAEVAEEKVFYMIAPDDFQYPEYSTPNWLKGQKYKATDKGHMLDLESETGTFHFAGNAREEMEKMFTIVE